MIRGNENQKHLHFHCAKSIFGMLVPLSFMSCLVAWVYLPIHMRLSIKGVITVYPLRLVYHESLRFHRASFVFPYYCLFLFSRVESRRSRGGSLARRKAFLSVLSLPLQ